MGRRDEVGAGRPARRMRRPYIIAGLCVLLLLVFPRRSLAAGQMEAAVEQAHAVMPEITVYFHGGDDHGWEGARITASLEGAPLELVDSGPFSSLGEGVLYYFLVDCSTSISPVQMENIRAALLEFAAGMGPRDRLCLIAFGAEVEVLLAGEEASPQMEEAIAGLVSDQYGTRLFDAINLALSLSESAGEHLPARKAAVIFSDAEEFSVGSYTHGELLDQLEQTMLPLYVVGLDNGSKESLDAIGVLARSSGGNVTVVSPGGIPSAVEDFARDIRSARYARFRADSNVASGRRETLFLQVKHAGGGRSTVR